MWCYQGRGEMTDKLLSDRQLVLMREAHNKLKSAFPNDNIGICFNLTHKHSDMNYNIKLSGIHKSS